MPPKAYEPDDPMELQGMGFPGGNLEEMAECLVEEYVRLGFTDQQLWGLFRNPFFAMTHTIYRAKGEAWVRGVIDQVREKWEQPRFTLDRRAGEQRSKGAGEHSPPHLGSPAPQHGNGG